MRRRALLASIGGLTVAMAGCGARNGAVPGTGDDPENDLADDPEVTDDETDDDGRADDEDEPVAAEPPNPDQPPIEPDHDNYTDRLIEHEAADRTIALLGSGLRVAHEASKAVRFVRPPDENGPGLLEATLTNASSFEQVVRLREQPPFGGVDSARPEGYADVQPIDTSYEYHRFLVPTAEHDFVDREPSFERDENGVWRRTGTSATEIPDYVRLAPGATIYGQWALVGHEEAHGEPFATGRYPHRWRDGGITYGVWRTSEPGPAEPSELEDVDVPDLPQEDRMAWFHEADGRTRAYLHPDRETATLPAKIDLTLVNHTHDDLGGNPHEWALHKLVDGEWFRIAPRAIPIPYTSLEPGGTRSWTLRAFDEHSYRPDSRGIAGGSGVPYLGPGRYAYSVGISGDDRTHAALLEFDGDPVTVTPDEGLDVDREEETVRVEDPEFDDLKERDRAVYTLRRLEEDPGTIDDRIIPEQVMRPSRRPLRNTIGFLDPDVETVRLETERGGFGSIVDNDDEGRRFVFGPTGEFDLDLEFGLAVALELDLEFDRLPEGERQLPVLARDRHLVVHL